MRVKLKYALPLAQMALAVGLIALGACVGWYCMVMVDFGRLGSFPAGAVVLVWTLGPMFIFAATSLIAFGVHVDPFDPRMNPA